MKRVVIAVSLGVLMGGNCFAMGKYIEMSTEPGVAVSGEAVKFECTTQGEVQTPIQKAKIVISNLERPNGDRIISRENMEIHGTTASYQYVIPEGEEVGNWKFKCVIKDQVSIIKDSSRFEVVVQDMVELPVKPPLLSHNQWRRPLWTPESSVRGNSSSGT